MGHVTPSLTRDRTSIGLLIIFLCGVVSIGIAIAFRAVAGDNAALPPSRPQSAVDALSFSRWRIISVVDGVPNFITHSNNASGPLYYLLGAGLNRVSFYLKPYGASPMRIRVRSWSPGGAENVLFRDTLRPGRAALEQHVTFKLTGGRGWRGLYSDAVAVPQRAPAARKAAMDAIRALASAIRRRSLSAAMRLTWLAEVQRNASKKLAHAWTNATLSNWSNALRKYKYFYLCPSKFIKVRAFQRGILIWVAHPGGKAAKAGPFSGPGIVKLFSAPPRRGTAADAFGDLMTLPYATLLWTGKRWVFAPI